jgi:hypothetical protein
LALLPFQSLVLVIGTNPFGESSREDCYSCDPEVRKQRALAR